jgi:hypothetical protein
MLLFQAIIVFMLIFSHNVLAETNIGNPFNILPFSMNNSQQQIPINKPPFSTEVTMPDPAVQNSKNVKPAGYNISYGNAFNPNADFNATDAAKQIVGGQLPIDSIIKQSQGALNTVQNVGNQVQQLSGAAKDIAQGVGRLEDAAAMISGNKPPENLNNITPNAIPDGNIQPKVWQGKRPPEVRASNLMSTLSNLADKKEVPTPSSNIPTAKAGIFLPFATPNLGNIASKVSGIAQRIASQDSGQQQQIATKPKITERIVYELSKRQKLAQNEDFPLVYKIVRDDWNFQVMPPNIAQKQYVGSNTHLKPVVFQYELDSKAFEFIGRTNDINNIRAMLNKISSIDVQTVDGNTLLHFATLHSNYDAMMLLVHKGANVNMQNDYGATPLHVAAYMGDAIAIAILLDVWADCNIIDENDMSPLMYSVVRGDHYSVKKLLIHGANVDFVNNHGFTAVSMLKSYPNSKISKLLREKSFNYYESDYGENASQNIAVLNRKVFNYSK